MKKIYTLYTLHLTLCAILALTFSSCAPHTPQKPEQPVIILFENDVHCAIEGYASLSALRNELRQVTPYVSIVSAGDFAQGAAIGSLSRGESIVKVMNAVGYDATTVGNHEFDYGIPQQQRLFEMLDADVVCCNFTDNHNRLIYAPFSLRQYGNITIAFVGAATPTTFTSSTPTFFEDENGNCIYSFHAEDSFELIQKAVDKARRKGADYVIVLSHLGDDTALDNSVDMIHATTGIDAVFDGHQHHILNETIANAEGQPVILASTGTMFQRFGKLTIDTAGILTVDLVNGEKYSGIDPAIELVINEILDEMHDLVSQVVGYTEVPLTMLKDGKRETRKGETNLADLLTDAFRDAAGADIGIMNGGGIRNHIKKTGDITFGDIYSIIPFNNTIRKLECTGQQLLDALEVGLTLAPEENGDFFQVSGLRYTYTTSVPSSVIFDHNNLFLSVGDTRRVLSAEVERNGKWEPLQPEAIYTLGGQSYILTSKGAAGALQYMTEVECEHIGDVEAVINYLNKIGRVTKKQYGKSQNRISVQ
ncbi:MAG: bifunctional metallophosphatase/5'-nucleotidase [Paludibacteraceae bacterium]|nr:bifunctional metallophosphatase/5'-nucleotidase [Paludibacteraceae bacterium]